MSETVSQNGGHAADDRIPGVRLADQPGRDRRDRSCRSSTRRSSTSRWPRSAASCTTPIDQIQWVVTGYMLALAAVIPVTGWAARRFGAKQVYIVSLVLFTAGSVLCGLASSSNELIAFRVLQGLGGGMILPIGQLIMATRGRPLADGAGDEHRGRAGDARADPRAHDRRPDPRPRQLALDLLREPADRRDRRGGRAARAAHGRARKGRPARRARPGAAVDGRAPAHLRAGGDRLHRRLHQRQGGRSPSWPASC